MPSFVFRYTFPKFSFLHHPMDAQKAPMANKSDAEANKWMGVLAYFGLLCVIPLFAARQSPFAQFHAKQGLVLTIAWFGIGFLTTFLPWSVEDLIDTVAGIVIAVLGIMGIIAAWKGELKELPIIGPLAKSMKF